MFYRVTAILAFISQDEANDFYHDCEVALPKSVTINPDQPNGERGLIQLHNCFHDQDPNIPCQLISREQTPP